MKKLLALALVAVMMLAFVACGNDTPAVDDEKGITSIEDIKFGLICLHDENSTYDKNFIEAFYEAVDALGLKEDQYVVKTNIPEGNECYEAAVDLAEDGCNIIFANSFGHESYVLQAAKEYPNVQFCHATGVKAHTENLPNYHNAFASFMKAVTSQVLLQVLSSTR